jgi:hypothetical protein
MRRWGGAPRIARTVSISCHPRANLLKHRSLIAARELESDMVRDVEPVYRACERLRPLLDWLNGHAVAAP